MFPENTLLPTKRAMTAVKHPLRPPSPRSSGLKSSYKLGLSVTPGGKLGGGGDMKRACALLAPQGTLVGWVLYPSPEIEYSSLPLAAGGRGGGGRE